VRIEAPDDVLILHLESEIKAGLVVDDAYVCSRAGFSA
jgi:hypothetical protein